MRDCDIPDNYDLFRRHEADQEARLEKRPRCCQCGEHIQDETAFYIGGEYICEDCIEDFRVPVDDD